jgi:formylglycine-generating enzyme required for sulfatase activity
MRYVPAGSFQRDSGSSNISKISAGYWMGETEVTQELYDAVMGTNPSTFSSTPAAGETQNKRPVEQVTWYDAVEFCNKLSTVAGRTAAYTITGRTPSTGYPITSATVAIVTGANGYRLPTEMEWMWAAMGRLVQIPAMKKDMREAAKGAGQQTSVTMHGITAMLTAKPIKLGIKRPTNWG